MLDKLSLIDTDIILGMLMIGCAIWLGLKQRAGSAAYIFSGITGLAAALYSLDSGITYNAALIWTITFVLLMVGYTCDRLLRKR